MADLYDRMRITASRLMSANKQGAVLYVEPGDVSGPGYAPVIGAPSLWELDATVKGVSARYVDGTHILATDLEVTFAVFGRNPSLEGAIEIDGRTHQIVQVSKIPGAGDAVAWKVVVRS